MMTGFVVSIADLITISIITVVFDIMIVAAIKIVTFDQRSCDPLSLTDSTGPG